MTTQDKMELLKLAAQITAARVANDPQEKLGGKDTAAYLQAVYKELQSLYQA